MSIPDDCVVSLVERWAGVRFHRPEFFWRWTDILRLMGLNQRCFWIRDFLQLFLEGVCL
jgi:hypothetical protein